MNSFNKKNRFLWMILIISFSTTGCSTVYVKAIQASNADDISKKTVVSFLWSVKDYKEDVNCNGNGLQYVNVKTNFIYAVCSVVTLGMVVPFDIEYRCTSEPLGDGGEIGGGNGE